MKVGVLGTGGMGNVHARHYANMPEIDLVAWDRDPDKLGAFCKHHEAQKLTCFEDLLEVSDLVDICLPTPLHLEFVLAALEAKRPTLVEKPMARRLHECRQMIEASQSAGVELGVGHVVRFFPEHRLAHDLIQQGKIGTPAAARLRRGGRAPVGSDRWFQDPEQSGGVILDLGIHELDWLLWTFGECRQVFARSVRLGETVPDAQFEGDYALITLSFTSGLVAHVEATWMDPGGFRATIEVSGDQGMVEYDSRANPAVRTATDLGPAAGSFMHSQGDPYYLHLSAVVDAVRHNHPMPVSGEEGMAAVALAEAAIQSAAESRPVDPRPLLAATSSGSKF